MNWLELRGWQIDDSIVCPCCRSIVVPREEDGYQIHRCKCGWCKEEET